MSFIKSLFYIPTVLLGAYIIYKDMQNPMTWIKYRWLSSALAVVCFGVQVTIYVLLTREISVSNVLLLIVSVFNMNGLLYFSGVYQLLSKKVKE